MGGLAYAVLALGALRLWYPGIFAGLLVVLLVWGVHDSFTRARRRRRGGRAPLDARVENSVGGFRPAVPDWRGGAGLFYDSLHYHLGIPNLYRLMHRIVPVHDGSVRRLRHDHSVALRHGDHAGQHAQREGGARGDDGTCFLLAMGYVMRSAGGFSAAPPGGSPPLLVVSIPMVAINATTAGTDVAGAFLLFASAAALILALEQKTPALMRLAGVLTGLAASTKYPAFTFIPIACALVLAHFVWDEKKPWRANVGALVGWIFTGFALLGIAPVLIKNVVMHGNPVYPFGGILIGHPRVDPVEWHKFVSDTSPRNLPAVFGSWPAFGRWLAEPWFLVFAGQGIVGPLLLMGLPFALRRTERPLAFRTLQRYALLLWWVWLATSTVPRYGLPAMVLATPVMAEAVCAAAIGWLRWPLLLGALSASVSSPILRCNFC